MALLKGWRFPNWVTLGLAVLFASAWLVISILFKELEELHSHLPKIVSEISIEFFKAIIIGVCVGLGVEAVLKISERRAEVENSAASMLTQCDLQSLYGTRSECKNLFKSFIENEHTRHVWIAGISLRDFLGPQGEMRSVWQAIVQRLRTERINRVDDSRRLKVKLLLLDPLSAEGQFRYKVEEQPYDDSYKAIDTDQAFKAIDIEQALKEIQLVKNEVYQGHPQPYLEVRLYGHCPFSFLFLTDNAVFVEQYYYRQRTDNLSAPVLRYKDPSRRSELFRLSFHTMWKWADEERISVGTALPIERSRIKNIFRAENRVQLGQRQVASINAVENGTIDILAISGNHYINNQATSEVLVKKSNTTNPQPVKIRLALLNPISQQAILRAVADDRTVRDIRDALCKWDWMKHKRSRLYNDIHRNIHRVSNWKDRGCLFEVRLYSSSVACASLLTSNSVFVEQYLYGRTKKLQVRDILIGEYPVIEYTAIGSNAGEDMSLDKTECEVVSSNFEIIWDCYSIAAEDFLEWNKEEQFAKNLTSLQEELGCLVNKAAPEAEQSPLTT